MSTALPFQKKWWNQRKNPGIVQAEEVPSLQYSILLATVEEKAGMAALTGNNEHFMFNKKEYELFWR